MGRGHRGRGGVMGGRRLGAIHLVGVSKGGEGYVCFSRGIGRLRGRGSEEDT